jgi:hypothetical protein
MGRREAELREEQHSYAFSVAATQQTPASPFPPRPQSQVPPADPSSPPIDPTTGLPGSPN